MSICDCQRIDLKECSHTISSAVQSALNESAYRSLGRLRCDYRDGVLTLAGEVPTFFLKQMAQSLAANVSGVARVANDIHVSAYISRKALRR